MKDLKILILSTYYEKPNMVRNALQTILNNNETYKNWELAFIDDGSIKKGRPVVEEILKDHLDKVKFYYTNDSIEKKLSRGGSFFGQYMNKSIEESDAEICFWLMDDDFLFDDYFFNLNKWFNENKDEYICCCNWMRYFIPSNNVEIWTAYNKERNRTKGGIWSVAWRTECNKMGGVKFPYPLTISLDSPYMKDLYDKYGVPQLRGKRNYGNFFMSCKTEYQGNLSSIYTRGERKIDTYNDIRDISINMNYILDKKFSNPFFRYD